MGRRGQGPRLHRSGRCRGEAMTATVSTSSEESLWRKATAAGIDRKTFLRLMTVGGSAAVGAALAQLPRERRRPGAAAAVLQGRLPRVLPQAVGDRARRALVRLHQLHHAGRALLRAQPLCLAGREPHHLEPEGARRRRREPDGVHLRRPPGAAAAAGDPLLRVLRQRPDAQLGAARLRREGRQLGVRRRQPGRVGVHPDQPRFWIG